jgi:hypothetical protein
MDAIRSAKKLAGANLHSGWLDAWPNAMAIRGRTSATIPVDQQGCRIKNRRTKQD